MISLKNIIIRYHKLILTLTFSFTAIFLYGSLSLHENVWYDEAYQLVLTENSLTDIIKHVALDHHAPFYAIGFKLVTLIFGISPVVGRFFSLSAIICCFVLAFYKIKDLFNLKTAIIFSTLLLSLSCIYYCSIEIRPYSWSMFLTLASTVYMISIIKNQDKKSWILYVIFSILAMYAHNFSFLYIFFSTLMFGAYILLKNTKLIKNYLISCLIFIIIYLPWLSTLLFQYKTVKDGFWIEKSSLSYYLKEIKLMFSNNDTIIIVLTGLLLFSIIYILIKKIDKKYNILLNCCFFGTFAFICFMTMYETPIFVTRYLVTFIGIFLLIYSDITSSNKSNTIFIILLIVLLVNSAINYKNELKLTNEDKLNESLEYFSNEQYFIHYTEFTLGEFRYYFPNAKHFITNEIISSLNDYELFGDNVIVLNNISELNNYNINTIWTVGLYTNIGTKESRDYFKTWNEIDKYHYIDTYNFNNYFLNKLSKEN